MHNKYAERVSIQSGGILLKGPMGLYQLEDAKELAGKSLGMEESALTQTPDFISVGDGKSQITADIVAGLIARLMVKPVKAQRHVVLIHGANLMNETAQNKLLKMLEEWDALFLLIAYGDVLKTIESRCMVIPYRPLSLTQFLKQGKTELDYYLSGGCIQRLSDAKVCRIFEEAAGALISGDDKAFFKVLGLVKEKDKTSFFEKHKEYVPQLFDFLGNQLVKSGHALNCDIAMHLACAVKDGMKNYTSADFFADMANLMEEVR